MNLTLLMQENLNIISVISSVETIWIDVLWNTKYYHELQKICETSEISVDLVIAVNLALLKLTTKNKGEGQRPQITNHRCR